DVSSTAKARQKWRMLQRDLMSVRSGLLAAVSRIAAILPNDLAPTNMNGPNRTFTAPYNAAVQLSHCGHSCMAQHFCRLKRRCADRADINQARLDASGNS
ncbi:hypothetical protein, partial [uncultured Boseongicola sp.]|uniref:hypothetical protein n=1 Tax=uncultured Boseongicola sp. TaxID=1648499 RepID=UPI002609FAC6